MYNKMFIKYKINKNLPMQRPLKIILLNMENNIVAKY